MLQIERSFVDDMIAHARAEAPNECCGLLAGKDGRVVKVFGTNNTEKSPVRYNVDPRELLQIDREIEAQGWQLVGIYHSHTHTQAYPSATDVKLAFWPGVVYLIISLKDRAGPVMRAFRIEDDNIMEEELQVV